MLRFGCVIFLLLLSGCGAAIPLIAEGAAGTVLGNIVADKIEALGRVGPVGK